MPTGLDYMMSVPATAIGKGKVGAPAEKPGKMGIKVKAAIFFDGTGNNQNNITKRLNAPSYGRSSWYKAESASDYESYDQYYSNVATLYFMHQKKVAGEYIASVYMEGIGTSNDGPDDTPGLGFGAGPTGIVARVNRGINDLRDAIKDSLKRAGKNSYLEEVTVYAFGFSRGAAAARHFCARRTEARGGNSSLCQALGVKSEVVKIKFVGLFDTVSSFDPSGEETPATPSDTSYVKKAARHLSWRQGDAAFRDDVAELHLTLDDPTLGQVVQLAAADEYRLNFSATSIASARQRGTGYELLLPGAHSDIGGGYAQKLPEEREYGEAFSLRVADFFKARGWYGPGQVSPPELKYTGDDEHPATVVYGRRTLPGNYQYVALSIMLKLAAQANSGLHFGSPNQGEARGIKYVVQPTDPLFAIKTQLESYALSQFGATRALTVPLAEPAYRWLRQHYLHLSWNTQRLGFDLRTDAQGLPTRLVLAG